MDGNESTLDFGQAVTGVGDESIVEVWGRCDSERAWLVRDRLDDLVVRGQRRITVDVSDLRFADFSAVAILVGALARIRQVGAEVTVCPSSSGAYRVLKWADLTTGPRRQYQLSPMEDERSRLTARAPLYHRSQR